MSMHNQNTIVYDKQETQLLATKISLFDSFPSSFKSFLEKWPPDNISAYNLLTRIVILESEKKRA
jgi:hypothetical protein